MNPIFSIFIAQRLALNQGVTQKQAMLDGVSAMLLKQPMGLVFALFMAKNQAANQSPKVTLAASSTALTVTPTLNAAGANTTPVSFSATVTRSPLTSMASLRALTAPAPPVPGGAIAFSEIISGAPVMIGTVPLDATGTATLSNVTVPPGTHTYVAIYSGDAIYQRGVSPIAGPTTYV